MSEILFKDGMSTMNIWHDISPKRISPDSFYAVIEISKGSKIKYERENTKVFSLFLQKDLKYFRKPYNMIIEIIL